MAQAVIEIDSDSDIVCPVCDDLCHEDTIQQHVEAHFNNEDKNGIIMVEIWLIVMQLVINVPTMHLVLIKFVLIHFSTIG